MIDCGSQILFCDLPIRFDNYRGCAHRCKYCFLQRKTSFDIEIMHPFKELENFITGFRNYKIRWANWKIPLHWGGLSDPFQPIEKEAESSYNCLKIFQKYQYPFVVSTKGLLINTPKYLDIIGACNAVVQVSLVSKKFDVYEQLTDFESRFKMLEPLSRAAKRLIIRISPYLPELKSDIIKNLKRYKEQGVYGISIESIKYFDKKPGLVKVFGDFMHPIEVVRRDFIDIKNECQKAGLTFLCAENRLRSLSDDMNCCMGYMEGFQGNKYNVAHLKFSNSEIKKGHCEKSNCFKALTQQSCTSDFLRQHTFKEIMDIAFKSKFFDMIG